MPAPPAARWPAGRLRPAARRGRARCAPGRSPVMTDGPIRRSPATSGSSPSSAAISVDLPEPLRPVRATRRATPGRHRPAPIGSCRARRRRPPGGRRSGRPGARPTVDVQPPGLARLVDPVERSRRRSIAPAPHRSRGVPGPPHPSASSRCRSAASSPAGRPGAPIAAARDRGLKPRPLLVVGAERVPGAAAGGLPARAGTRPSRRRRSTPGGELVQLDHGLDMPFEQSPVVGHYHGAGRRLGEKPLQRLEPFQVEIVRGARPAAAVEPRQQQGGQPCACTLASREQVQRLVDRRRPRPSSSQTAAARASRSSPPRARNASSASLYPGRARDARPGPPPAGPSPGAATATSARRSRYALASRLGGRPAPRGACPRPAPAVRPR